MKFTVTADCTPAEARAFLGLPDLEPLHAVYVSRTEEWLRGQGIADLVRGFGAMGGGKPGTPVDGAPLPVSDPAALIETMVRRLAPLGEAGMGMMQSMMSQMAGAARSGGASGASGAPPPPGTPGTRGGGAADADDGAAAAHPS